MMENKLCVKCQEVIHPLRVKALPNTMTCVNCSTVGAKRGVPVTLGEKDHTWNEMIIMDSDEFEVFEQKKNYIEKEILEPKESDDEDDDEVVIEEEDEDDLTDWDNTLLDGLEDL
jgi:hypothetical protein